MKLLVKITKLGKTVVSKFEFGQCDFKAHVLIYQAKKIFFFPISRFVREVALPLKIDISSSFPWDTFHFSDQQTVSYAQALFS